MKRHIDKKAARLQRAARGRAKIRELGLARLTVHRTPRHIYAQIIGGPGGGVLAAASTVQETVRSGLKATGNVAAAAAVGKEIAARALEKGVTAVAFDRSGFRFHGRIKALAEAAREGGLKF